MNDKENYDPKGILKEKASGKLSRRRVSFAPEVTLHKIDFVQRRETIAGGEMLMEKGMGEEVSGEERKGEEVSGEERKGEERKGEDRDEPQTQEYPQTQYPQTQEYPQTQYPQTQNPQTQNPQTQEQTHLPNSVGKDILDDSSDEDDEVPMELTDQIDAMTLGKIPIDNVLLLNEKWNIPHLDVQKMILDSANTNDMEFTQPVSTINGEAMEFTQPVSSINKEESFKNQNNNVSSISQLMQNDDMEFTQQVSTIKPKVDGFQSQEMELTQPVSNISQKEPEMELTQPVSNMTPQEPEMELTQPVSNMTPQAEPEMEFTQPVSNIARQPEPEMELTQQMSTITEENEDKDDTDDTQKPMEPVKLHNVPELLPERANNSPSGLPQKSPSPPLQKVSSALPEKPVSTPPVESQQMEFTLPISTINYSKESTPQFPDAEVPIPEDLNETPESSRKRPYHFNDDYSHKLPKIDQVSTTTNIPLADVSHDSIESNDENYTNVSLSEFLKDLGIRFYDDLEIDNIRFSISATLNEDFTEEDYIKANNLTPLYNLYKFSNEELTKNINEGKELYNQLNETTLSNNPRLFKDYYASDLNEQLMLKSEFLLIKDFSRCQAKKIWYNWRIQLVEILLIQLDEKLYQLNNDKQKIIHNLQEIKSMNIKAKDDLTTLTLKFSKLKNLQGISKHYSEQEIKDIQSQLIQNKHEFGRIRTQVIEKQDQLNDINRKVHIHEDTSNHLKQEITHHQRLLNENKNYELNEIKLLTFKFNVLQQVSHIKYLGKSDHDITFMYKNHIQLVFNHNQPGFLITIAKEMFHNHWLVNHANNLIQSISCTDNNTRLQHLNQIITSLQTIDNDIFKISLKFPVIPISFQDSIGFYIRYYSSQFDCKINFEFNLPLSQLNQYPFDININAHLVKLSPNLHPENILPHLQNEYNSNNLLSHIKYVSLL